MLSDKEYTLHRQYLSTGAQNILHSGRSFCRLDLNNSDLSIFHYKKINGVHLP